MRDRALQVYCRTKSLHHEVFLELTRLKGELAKEQNLCDAIDTIGVLKKTLDLVKDLKMEVDRCVSQMEKVSCALYIRRGEMGEPVRGEWVTGTPYSKSIPKMPSFKADKEKYIQMLVDMGVPEHIAANGALRPHYPSMVEYMNVLEEQGLKLPSGVDHHESDTEFSVRCVFHRSADLDAMCSIDD